jgi:hypothetical protein
MTRLYKTKGYVVNKICGCGKVHEVIPETAQEWFEDGLLIGFIWDCECKSTLFTATFDLKKKLGAA